MGFQLPTSTGFRIPDFWLPSTGYPGLRSHWHKHLHLTITAKRNREREAGYFQRIFRGICLVVLFQRVFVGKQQQQQQQQQQHEFGIFCWWPIGFIVSELLFHSFIALKFDGLLLDAHQGKCQSHLSAQILEVLWRCSGWFRIVSHVLLSMDFKCRNLRFAHGSCWYTIQVSFIATVETPWLVTKIWESGSDLLSLNHSCCSSWVWGTQTVESCNTISPSTKPWKLNGF